MPEETDQAPLGRILASVLYFWVAYVGVTLAAGYLTTQAFTSEVWQLTAWGFTASAGLVLLSRQWSKRGANPPPAGSLTPTSSTPGHLLLGLVLGLATYGLHVAVISTFAGPLHFERVAGVGAMTAVAYLVRFLATSCMEEVGFRGYALRRLLQCMGPWPAVFLTSIAFGLSHLSYGWDLETIALGVVPPGLLWGMSAIATRGLAVPIGLHAAWNFAGWTAGGRAETGLLRMTLEDEALGRTEAVGTASYLVLNATLTLAFWLLHRRNVRRGRAFASEPV